MEKEKIGMEKLIELLNERMKEEEKIGPKRSRFLNYDGINHVFRLNNGCSFCMEFVLSKRYGFIKWLVDNDKIAKRKIDTRLVRNVENHYDEDGYWVENSYEDYSDTDTLLMLLSISSSPIDDLISYLR